MAVTAIGGCRNNAELIVKCRTLGYLQDDWPTLDPTYGRGSFWKLWKPDALYREDRKLTGTDYRSMPHYSDGVFYAVAFDPPYKLNGTPDDGVDERFGVDEPATRDERHDSIRAGITECMRVLRPTGILLVKCQNQVNGGRVRWQTRIFGDHAEAQGAQLIDMLYLVGGRPQPTGRSSKHRPCKGVGCIDCIEGRVPTRQQHAAQNYSNLLVLRKDKAPRAKATR